MTDMYEGQLYDHIRELERELRNRTPASKSDIDDLNERLARIEKSLAALAATARKTDERLADLNEAEPTSLVPDGRRHESIHH